MITSVFENAKQVLREGYVSAIEDGDVIRLHWVATRGYVGDKLAVAILHLLYDGDAVISTREAFAGTRFVDLVEVDVDEVLVDCG